MSRKRASGQACNKGGEEGGREGGSGKRRRTKRVLDGGAREEEAGLGGNLLELVEEAAVAVLDSLPFVYHQQSPVVPVKLREGGRKRGRNVSSLNSRPFLFLTRCPSSTTSHRQWYLRGGREGATVGRESGTVG